MNWRKAGQHATRIKKNIKVGLTLEALHQKTTGFDELHAVKSAVIAVTTIKKERWIATQLACILLTRMQMTPDLASPSS